MGRFMTRNADNVMVGSNAEGVNKVIKENGNYAFFMESTTISYLTERNCRLQQVKLKNIICFSKGK